MHCVHPLDMLQLRQFAMDEQLMVMMQLFEASTA
jgi:hypothetical protein